MFSALARLIRLPNLIIIGITQVLMRYLVIDSFLDVNDFELQLGEFHFLLLVLSTILIAAGGYAINDYFDTQPDRMNKPGKVVIDRVVSRRFAITLHSVLTFTGVLLGVYLSFYIGISGLSVIFILAAGLLWFYSTNYKRQFLIGNIIVSTLTAAVPILVILFEIPLLNNEYGEIMIKHEANFTYIFYWVSGFGFFAFFSNLIREIVKDTEDFEGDSAYGMNTFPVVLGIQVTKIVIISLIILLLGFLTWALYRFILFSGSEFDYTSAVYFALLVYFPLVVVIYYVFIAKNKRDYHIASQLLKVVMLTGVIYSFVVYYILNFRLI